jgi:hypothetical protein
MRAPGNQFSPDPSLFFGWDRISDDGNVKISSLTDFLYLTEVVRSNNLISGALEEDSPFLSKLRILGNYQQPCGRHFNLSSVRPEVWVVLFFGCSVVKRWIPKGRALFLFRSQSVTGGKIFSARCKLMMVACESGGIGRRTRLRIWRVKPWGFESPLSHQSTPDVHVWLKFRCANCPLEI